MELQKLTGGYEISVIELGRYTQVFSKYVAIDDQNEFKPMHDKTNEMSFVLIKILISLGGRNV